MTDAVCVIVTVEVAVKIEVSATVDLTVNAATPEPLVVAGEVMIVSLPP